MRRAGTVVGSAQGLVVVRSGNDSYPDVGATLVNEDLDEVGEVVEVFGPVETPYVAVSPTEEVNPAVLLDDPVYER